MEMEERGGKQGGRCVVRPVKRQVRVTECNVPAQGTRSRGLSSSWMVFGDVVWVGVCVVFGMVFGLVFVHSLQTCGLSRVCTAGDSSEPLATEIICRRAQLLLAYTSPIYLIKRLSLVGVSTPTRPVNHYRR